MTEFCLVANSTIMQIGGLNKFAPGQKDHLLYFDTPRNYLFQAQIWSSAENILDKITLDLVLSSKVSLRRTMTGSGMHREVLTSLSVKLNEDFHSVLCSALFVEEVLPSVYLDIYELERRNVAQLYYNSTIDIEKTAYESSNHTLLVIKDMLIKGNSFEATYKLPWHARYHQPSHEGYVNITVPAPEVYLMCNGSNFLQLDELDNDQHNFVWAPCPHRMTFSNEKMLCVWIKFSNIAENNLIITWPIGIISHQVYVTSVTLALIFYGVYSILLTVNTCCT